MSEPICTLPPDVHIEESVVPFSESVSWADDMLGIEDAWRATQGDGILIGVLDTGIDAMHVDLRGAVTEAKDFTNSRLGTMDKHGHGTHVAGLVAARSGNDVGIRGIAPKCKIWCGKTLGDNGTGSEAQIMLAVRGAYDAGCQIISMSLGGPSPMVMLAGLIAELAADAKAKGRPFVVFAAAGNDGGSLNYPAATDGVAPIGAFGEDGKITPFTSRSAKLRLLAPGVKMLSTMPGNRYGLMTGTSQATPIAAAIAALALAKEKVTGSETSIGTSADAEDHLFRNAVDAVNGTKFKTINARKAVEAIGAKPIKDERPWTVRGIVDGLYEIGTRPVA